MKARKIKTEANTQQAFKPPNSTRVQKPHKPRKDINPYKYTSAPQNPLKTPLKREIEPYLQAMHHKQSRKADKRQGTHHERRGQARKPAHLPPVDTSQGRQKATTCPHFAPTFQNMFRFRPFLSPKIPRKHQAPPKNH